VKIETVKHLVEFSLEGGDTILVEVDEPGESIGRVARRLGEIAVQAKQSFEDAVDKIKPVAAIIITKLRSLSDQPDEVEVKFGLKMSAEAGAIIAVAGVEANYEITLKWKRE
jgi:hypothetical protein